MVLYVGLVALKDFRHLESRGQALSLLYLWGLSTYGINSVPRNLLGGSLSSMHVGTPDFVALAKCLWWPLYGMWGPYLCSSVIYAEFGVRVERDWAEASCWLPKGAVMPWHLSTCCPFCCGYFLITAVPDSLCCSPRWVHAWHGIILPRPPFQRGSICNQHSTFLLKASAEFWVILLLAFPNRDRSVEVAMHV